MATVGFRRRHVFSCGASDVALAVRHIPYSAMIAITGATGHLGRLVIDHLRGFTPTTGIIACVRDPVNARDLLAKGIHVRHADYDVFATLDRAFVGVDQLLFISGSDVGRRVAQHRNVIEAARRQGVKRVVYTSVLHADTSPLGLLADEHRETEAMLARSGLPCSLLRNSWYTENYTAAIPAALANGALLGSAGRGRIASAARNDYAEAAARVIAGSATEPAVYELAGDQAYTLADLAAEVSRQTGRDIPYRDLPPAEYRDILVKAGLPEALAAAFASYDVAAAQGALFDDGHQLSRLLGRPTTPLSESVAVALRPPGVNP